MLNFLMLVGACGFTACAGLGCLQEKQVNKFEYLQQEKVDFHQDNRKLVSYNDEEYKITLSADELNNFVWDNLFDLTFSDSDNETFLANSGFSYNSISFNSPQLETSYIKVFGSGSRELCLNGYWNDDLNDDFVNGKFNLFQNYVLVSFEYDLIIDFDSSDNLNDFGDDFSNLYNSFKQAIDLDIQANNPSDDMPAVLQDFVEILVGGIQSLATGIAGGIVSMAKALFLEVSQQGAVTGLSVFGGIVAIFAGLALAIGITTKVYQWVTSLGN